MDRVEKNRKMVFVLLFLTIIAACLMYYLYKNENKNSANLDNTINEVNTIEPKVETGTAGSNIPLKDNLEEAEYQVELEMKNYLKEKYDNQIIDSKIEIVKIYSEDEEKKLDKIKDMNLGPDEIAFKVKYDLKIASDVDYNTFKTQNSKYDESSRWIKEISGVGVLKPNDSGDSKYKVTDFFIDN